MSRLTGFWFTVVFLCNSIAQADEPIPDHSLRAVLSAVPSAELPAKVGELIQKASVPTRPQVTLGATKVAVELKGGAAPAIVGAAVRAAPDLAAEIAGAAATQQPKLVKRIAKAAVAAAPSQAGRIVTRVCQAVPREYRGIAVSAAEAAPNASREILEAVGAVFPALKSAIQRALESSGQKPISVAGVLDAAALELAAREPSAVGSVSSAGNTADDGRMAKPPFIPLTGKIILQNGTEPGRNYASP